MWRNEYSEKKKKMIRFPFEVELDKYNDCGSYIIAQQTVNVTWFLRNTNRHESQHNLHRFTLRMYLFTSMEWNQLLAKTKSITILWLYRKLN